MLCLYFLNILADKAVIDENLTVNKDIAEENYQFKVHDSIFDTLGTDLLKRKHGFVAELVTNAGDALQKLKDYYKDDTIDIGRDIVIEIYKENGKNVFKIKDSGIGMTKEEVVKYIGTIGASGSKHSKDLVGRFGMGFYSVFREADKVEVHTRKHGTEKGHRVTLTSKSKEYSVREEQKDEPGTDVIVWLNDNIVLTNEDVQSWVLENMISNGDATHYNILVKKTQEEKDDELKVEMQRRKDEIQKKKDERKKKAEEKAEKEKTEEKADKDDSNIDKDNEEKVEKDDKNIIDKDTVEEEEPIDENLYEYNIVIDDYRVLKLAPWTDKVEELKAIYKERYGKNDLHFFKKVNFNIKQKIDKGKEWNTRFDALIFIPKVEDNMMMQQQKKTGKIEMFVGGSKINDPNLEHIGEFLKSFFIIVKSSEAILASTREEFLDSKNTVKNIANALTRKIVDMFIEQDDTVIHKHSKTIKTGLIENKRHGNESILERLAGIVTFETDSGLYCLNKYVNKIEDNNMLLKKAKDEENDTNEEKEDENEKNNEKKTRVRTD